MTYDNQSRAGLLRKLNRLPLLAPFLVALAVVINAISLVLPNVYASEIVVALAVVMGVTAALTLACKLLIKQSLTAAFAASCGVLVLAYYHLIAGNILGWLLNSPFRFMANTIGILLLVAVFLFAIIWLFANGAKRHRHLAGYLNLMCLGLLAVMSTHLAYCWITNRDLNAYLATNSRVKTAPLTNRPPDIFFIILDAYTSNESLQQFWHFDNREFVQKLNEKGFVFIKNSYSLSASTKNSLATTLNMEPLPAIGAERLQQQYFINAQYFKIRNAKVINQLNAMGYDLVNLSLFRLAGEKMYYTFSGFGFNLYDRLINNSILGSAVNVYKNRQAAGKNAWHINEEILDHLSHLLSHPGPHPRFVYAHIMSPHPPYVYDSRGNVHLDLDSFPDKARYLEQLKYTNQRMVQCLDALTRRSNNPPIIIIQGDHGSRVLPLGEQAEKENCTILNTMLLPGADPSWFWDGMVATDTFRLVFNRFFGANYPYLSKAADSGPNHAVAGPVVPPGKAKEKRQ